MEVTGDLRWHVPPNLPCFPSLSRRAWEVAPLTLQRDDGGKENWEGGSQVEPGGLKERDGLVGK
jgi:hypothetical protein